MRNFFTGVVLAAFISMGQVVFAFSEQGTERTIIWIVPEGEKPDLKVVEQQLAEIDIEIKIHKTQGLPSFSLATEIYFIENPLAVVWHDTQGGLKLLFVNNNEPEKISVSPGGASEEALYLKEFVKSRFEKEEDYISDLLVEVPYEATVNLPPSDSRNGKKENANPLEEKNIIPMYGTWGVAAGYRLKLHPDETFWIAHGLRFDVPFGLLKEVWVVRSGITIVFPTTIPMDDGTRFYTKGAEIFFGVGYIPIRFGDFDIEFGGGGGLVSTMAWHEIQQAGFVDGRWQNAIIDKSTNAAVQLFVLGGLYWKPLKYLWLRLYFESTFIFGGPDFNPPGENGIGAYPWQPVFGIDVGFKNR